MSSRKMFLVMDDQEEKHDQPWPSYHIEVPKRLEVIKERLTTTGLLTNSRIEHIPRREASEDEILEVHTKRYVDDVKATETMTVDQQEAFCTQYEDIYVNSATWRRAKLAAASAIDLVRAVATSRSKMNGIAFIRPPGHHAMPDEGCGFCIFNNVAIAARHAVKSGVARKVMIVDYDVHAGNGTQECLETEDGGESVKLISIHRYEHGKFWPNMPQTGIYHNYRNTQNIPLNTTSLTDSDYLALFTHIILPTIHTFQPDLLIVSSGFDAALGDPEGYMNVTPAGFATMIRMLMDTGIPVAAILEGGYFLEALAADAEWVVRALLGEKIPRIHVESIHPSIAEVIGRIHRRYQKTSGFFRKNQELRDVIKGTKELEDAAEPLSDYKGERTVCAPYDTRGIYTPFTEEKVEGFRSELKRILESYRKMSEMEDVEVHDYIEEISTVDEHVDQNFVGIKNGKLAFGSNAKLFVELLFICPLDTIYAARPIGDSNFDDIQLDDSLKELKYIKIFEHLPIFQL